MTNCDPSTCLSGDEVIDTPPTKGSLPNTTFIIIANGCNYDETHITALSNAGITNPYCGTSGTYPCHNIMGYKVSSYQRDELTDGQFCRMIDAQVTYRPFLGAYVDECLPGCSAPCDQCYVGTPAVDPNLETDPCSECYTGEDNPCNECNNVTPNITTIIQNQTLVQNFIHGNLIISSGSTLTINSEVTFSPISKITIENGAKLIITTNGLLTKCKNGDNWQGITILGINNSAPGFSSGGEVEITNGGTIEYAKIGILKENYIYQATGGTQSQVNTNVGKITMTRAATIRNCDTGIKLNGTGGTYIYGSGQESSTFDNSFFEDNDVGIDLQSNYGLVITNNTFTENFHALDVTNAHVDVTHNSFIDNDASIFINAYFPSLLGANVFDNAFIGGAAVYNESLNNADHLLVNGNVMVGAFIYNLGTSNFIFEENDLINNSSNAAITSSATAGYQQNLIQNNSFFNNFIGNDVDGINNIEYLSNCFENTAVADIGLGYNTTIKYDQGNSIEEAANCFDHGARLQTMETDPAYEFLYWKFPSPAHPSECKLPINAVTGHNYIVENAFEVVNKPCGSGAAIYGGISDFLVKYRDCKQYLQNNGNGDLTSFITQLQNEIIRLDNEVAAGNLNYWVAKRLIDKYKQCLDTAIKRTVIKTFEDSNGTDRTNAINFLLQFDDFRYQIMAYGILLQGQENAQARALLNTLNPVTIDEVDFVAVQQIMLDYLDNRSAYVLSLNDRNTIYQAGERRLPLSGFARTVYYELTGERQFITVPMFNQTLHNREISAKSNLISIYPNPSIKNANINIDIGSKLGLTNDFEVVIYNSQGSVIYAETLQVGNHSISLDDQKGLFFVKVTSMGKTIHTDKIIRL